MQVNTRTGRWIGASFGPLTLLVLLPVVLMQAAVRGSWSLVKWLVIPLFWMVRRCWIVALWTYRLPRALIAATVATWRGNHPQPPAAA